MQLYCSAVNMVNDTSTCNHIIDIEYNKRLDRQRPCLEDELNGGSSNIVQSNKSV